MQTRVCAIANTFAFLFTFNLKWTEEIPVRLFLILVNPQDSTGYLLLK